MADSERPTTLNTTRARQGRRGTPVFWVLVISTLLGAAVLFGSWLWRADDIAAVEPGKARTPADAAVFEAPTPADVTRQTGPATEAAQK